MTCAEPIPNDEDVSRLVIFPHMMQRGEAWVEMFEFGDRACASLVWRRHAATEGAVHAIGEKIVAEQRKSPGNEDREYRGFTTASVGKIREINDRSPGDGKQHGFDVEHAPEEGIYHAEVCYWCFDESIKAKPPGKSRTMKQFRNTLRVRLVRVFEEMGMCPAV